MKPVSLLQDNILQLEEDIFAEINIPSEVATLLLLVVSFTSNFICSDLVRDF